MVSFLSASVEKVWERGFIDISQSVLAPPFSHRRTYVPIARFEFYDSCTGDLKQANDPTLVDQLQLLPLTLSKPRVLQPCA